jgi:arylsulfatase A-like enzyme
VNSPNILLILTDQHRANALSAAGNPWVHTPNLDRLASEGVRFSRSYCTSPLCCPSRASIQTGRWSFATGVTTNHLKIKAGLPQLGPVFQASGYKTAWVGKWHLPNEYPLGQGEIEGFDNLDLPGRSRENNGYPVSVKGLEKGWKHNLGNYADAPVADRAVSFLQEKHDRPFLLVVSLMNPHDICFESEHYRAGEPGPGELPPLPANFEPPNDEPAFVRQHGWAGRYGWTEEKWRRYLWTYHRFVEQADAAVGRVLAGLKEAGRDEDTVVAYTSDHGEGVASHRWMEKLMLYEESIGVPLMVRWKGHTPAQVDTRRLVSGVDIFPTLCGYAGIPIPEGLDGQNLRPLIEDPALPGRPYVAAALHDIYKPAKKNPPDEGRMLSTGRWKYLVFAWGEKPEMLFDLQSDPGEARNLAPDPASRAELLRHRQCLKDFLARTGDDFVMPVP